MIYIFKGRLCGYICVDCPEPFSNLKVRLYRSSDRAMTARAVAKPKDTFAILSDDQVKEKASSLIAETETDAEGNFTFTLDEKQRYEGGAFEVDVYCETVPRRKRTSKPPTPLQFSITTLQPEWRRTENGAIAAWDYCLPFRYWCLVRGRFGAWTICGRLTTCGRDPLPVPGATVSAFDADWLQDDPLGSAVTDADGRFRIDYARESFEKTLFSPLINFEWVGGPDVYFTAELAGDQLLDENQWTGRTPGRENIGPCFCVDLCTEKIPKVLVGHINTPVAHACVESQQFNTCLTDSAPLNGIEIKGTAAGPPFHHYTLRYSYGGSPINHAVVYPNCGRPPGQTDSNVPVINGRLGWLDVNLLPPGVTEFTVYLDVFDSGAGSVSDTRTFSYRTNAVEITAVAQVNALEAEDPFNPGNIVKLIKDTNDSDVAVPEASIGGGFSVTGSAYIVGCDRILRQFLLARFDAPPASVVPTPADATGGTPLFLPPVQPVIYDDTTAHPWQSGCLFPTPNTILNGNLAAQWSTNTCINFSPPPDTYPIPKVKPILGGWGSGSLNGRFVLLLEVQDGPIAGPGMAFAAKDQVVVWIDNRTPTALITSVGGLAACLDLHLKDYVGTHAEIRGIAWDPPIVDSAPQQRPNENFGSYGLGFQKNGGGSGVIPIEAHLAPIPVPFGANVRVPNEWPAIVSADGKLTDWDIVGALDFGPGVPPPGSAKLGRGQRCAYVITLGVSDTTHVGDGGSGHPGSALYAINIINDIP